MIDPKLFFGALTSRGISFYAGVPDSLLANFCAYVEDHGGHGRHLITANEGNAVGVAMGYHMATGNIAAVYMQNSGLGNTINPLTSLIDPEVYQVPMLLIIGWRGEPGIKDEPQHVKQGKITLAQLDVLGIPYWVLDGCSALAETLDAAFLAMRQRNAPVALVVRKNTFGKYEAKRQRPEDATLTREAALEQLLALCGDEDLIVSTTGKTSREVFELRAKHGQKQQDFLTVGGMGHTSSIALGVAIGRPARRVICLDGDGSLLMHMGSLAVISNYQPHNLIHVLLNNQAHESVGGQPTAAHLVDFEKLTSATGYAEYAYAEDPQTLHDAWCRVTNKVGPVLLEIRIKKGSRVNLGRPTSSPVDNKSAFMEAAHVGRS